MVSLVLDAFDTLIEVVYQLIGFIIVGRIVVKETIVDISKPVDVIIYFGRRKCYFVSAISMTLRLLIGDNEKWRILRTRPQLR